MVNRISTGRIGWKWIIEVTCSGLKPQPMPSTDDTGPELSSVGESRQWSGLRCRKEAEVRWAVKRIWVNYMLSQCLDGQLWLVVGRWGDCSSPPCFCNVPIPLTVYILLPLLATVGPQSIFYLFLSTGWCNGSRLWSRVEQPSGRSQLPEWLCIEGPVLSIHAVLIRKMIRKQFVWCLNSESLGSFKQPDITQDNKLKQVISLLWVLFVKWGQKGLAFIRLSR